MQDKYGFVYLWYDRKHKKFYVGSHWGKEDDGYVCSSKWMRDAYRYRPQDFKRRILSKINDRSTILIEEQKWLDQIKPHEVGKKYYNLRVDVLNPWWKEEDTRKSVGEKISAKNRSNPNFGKWNEGIVRSEETREKLRQANLGNTHSEETKAKMRKSHNRDYSDPEFRRKMSEAAKNRSPETRKKISDNAKRLRAEGKIGKKPKASNLLV